jgi:hypothetical protein
MSDDGMSAPSGPNMGAILSSMGFNQGGGGGGFAGGGINDILAIGFGEADINSTLSSALGGSGVFKIFSFGLSSLDDMMQSPLFQGFQFMSLDSLGKLPTPLMSVSLENLSVGKLGGGKGHG